MSKLAVFALLVAGAAAGFVPAPAPPAPHGPVLRAPGKTSINGYAIDVTQYPPVEVRVPLDVAPPPPPPPPAPVLVKYVAPAPPPPPPVVRVAPIVVAAPPPPPPPPVYFAHAPAPAPAPYHG